MIGRGTRLCEDLLGIGEDKKEFLILISVETLNFSVLTKKVQKEEWYKV